MITVRSIEDRPADLARSLALYERAFPEAERIPAEWLVKPQPGKTLAGLYLDDALCGFAGLVTRDTITHMTYFAMDENFRGRGLGTEALRAIAAFCKDSRVVVDIEADTPDAPNPEERSRRRAFYLRAGYEDCSARYRWQGETYDLLSAGGIVSGEEFWAFWEDILGTRWCDDE